MDRQEQQRRLLALCAVKGAHWNVIARGALKPDGLGRLLAGELTEKSADADQTAEALAGATAAMPAHVERADRAIESAATVGARLITVLDEDYPANLRLIYNLPPFLFVRGKLRRDDAKSVAVVGTRKASEDGLKRAGKLASLLAAENVTVLSGLAAGVDTRAHEAALAAGGRTIAVIGTGILRTYPKENAALAERIVEGGAIVSQFWPDQAPTSYTFPRRNVVTSGMSQGTAVIEASSTSGAKMQARLALEHGKQVFLLHALVTDQPWARKYLDRGAIEVSDVATILERLRSWKSIEALTEARQQLALGIS
jgi:DNA processing protein